MDYRTKGKNALATVLSNQQNITVIEKNIFAVSPDEEFYVEYIYQIIGDILQSKKLKSILEDIKKKRVGWSHPSFEHVTDKINEQDNFIENPFEVEEGILECKCGSKRVYSYQKQSRSCDESSSTYAQCIVCKAKWVYSG